MKRIILIFLFLLISNIYAYSTNFQENSYYDEIIDVGLKDLEFSESTIVKISIYGVTELYYENTFLISEIKYIPIVFNNDIPGILEVIYEFKDNSGNIIDRKEYNLRLTEPSIPNFYLCSKESCLNNNFEFWLGDDVSLDIDKSYSNLEYVLSIETNQKQVLFQDSNISFPYKIPKNLISGNYKYDLVINITDKNNNRLFRKEMKFILLDITKEEYNSLTDFMLYSEENRGLSEEESPIVDSKEESQLERNILTKCWWIILFIIIVIVFYILIPKRRVKHHAR